MGEAVKIRADKVEREGDEYIIKAGDTEVGRFEQPSVQGWWVQDEEHAAVVFRVPRKAPKISV